MIDDDEAAAAVVVVVESLASVGMVVEAVAVVEAKLGTTYPGWVARMSWCWQLVLVGLGTCSL